MKEDNNIEDLFRSSFDHFEVAPPPVVKEAIDRSIGGSSKKRIWWFSALVMLLGAASLLFFFTQSNGKQDDRLSTNQLASTQSGTNHSSTTANSNTNQSTHEKSTSFTDQSNNKSTSSTQKDNTSKQATHSNGNQDGSSDGSGNNPLKSAKSKSGNKQPSSVKTLSKKSGKAKKTSGKSTKKSPKKRSKNDSGTPGFDQLSTLDLSEIALNDLGKSLGDDHSSNEGNGKSDPTEGNENGVGSTLPEKSDSISGKPKEPIITQAPDSTKTDGKDPKPKKEKSTESNWLASIYVGPSFGMNSKSNDALKSVSEKPSFQFSAEINRSLFKGYGLSTGFGFNQRQETFKLTNLQILDSAIVVFDSIPIYGNPNVPDSITGYQDTTYYYDDTLSTDFNQVNRIQTIGIPLYFTKHFSFSDQWGLLVNAGAVFQFNKYVTTQQASLMIPAPTVNNFSMNVTARIHATYTWKQWMFSAGVSTGWELKQALIYEGLDRKRYFITPQFAIHFRF